MKFPVPEKISKRFNKVVKLVYLDYRKNKMFMPVDGRTVFVQGNSDIYATTIVIPDYKVIRNRIFILTQVDERSNLIATYILSKEDLIKHSRRITGKGKINSFYQIRYSTIKKYNNNLLLNLTEAEFLKK